MLIPGNHDVQIEAMVARLIVVNDGADRPRAVAEIPVFRLQIRLNLHLCVGIVGGGHKTLLPFLCRKKSDCAPKCDGCGDPEKPTRSLDHAWSDYGTIRKTHPADRARIKF